ncbi:MAG: c-type cytochrome [Pirellulales bacterium]
MNRTNTKFQVLSVALLACLLAAAGGCMKSDPPRFRLNMEGKDPSEVSPEKKQALVDSLYALFGTPDEPYVVPESGLNLKKLQMAAGPAGADNSGGRHGLFRQHCVHCHGVTGDGDGPTALFLKPYPRDYRAGKYKFTSTGSSSLASKADLRKTIVDGINGTAMPSFALLPADEIDALTEYVKYLSIRGQTEFYIGDLIDSGETLPLSRQQLVDDALLVAVDLWNEAEEPSSEVIPPKRFEKLADADDDGRLSRDEVTQWLADNFSRIDADGDGQISFAEQEQPAAVSDPPITAVKNQEGQVASMAGDTDGDLQVSQQEFTDFVLGYFDKSDLDHDKYLSADERLAASILAGKQLFATTGGCVKCHGPTALGDNEEPIYDDWNAPKFNKNPEEMARLAKLFDLPIQQLNPRNLRLGLYRGGRRPVDIYRRLHAGIKGTPMPALGPSGANPAKFKSEEIWHLVDFVRSLPYDPLSQPYRQTLVEKDRN